jgi:hypothetical protein
LRIVAHSSTLYREFGFSSIILATTSMISPSVHINISRTIYYTETFRLFPGHRDDIQNNVGTKPDVSSYQMLQQENLRLNICISSYPASENTLENSRL